MAGEATLHQLLKQMVEMGASDLHLTTNSPPMVRLDGRLLPLPYPPLTVAEAAGRNAPERAAPVCGIDADTIRLVARTYARAEAAMAIWTMGINQSTHGSDGVVAINNLNLITGNVGRPGGGGGPGQHRDAVAPR